MELEPLLEKKIKPKAERIDREPRALSKALKLLARHKFLAQRVSNEYGGRNLDREAYFSFLEVIQSYSGALGFFQRQHQSAGRIISNCEKTSLKQEWLPLMARGKRKVGVSISHLRAPSTPCIEALPKEGGWSLKGHVSWVSGYRLFDWLIMGFFCPQEGLEGMGLFPFKKARTFKVSKVLDTIALGSMRTLSVELKDHFLPESHLISLKPIGSFGDSSNPLDVHFVNLSALALGFLRDIEAPVLQEAYEACREAYLEKGADESLYAEMNRIATHLSHIARFSGGTRYVICPNSVERRCRELMLFSVILPSKNVREACLKYLLQ
ncbi:MAG: acyl-CoA/acyl-ACP dehydrogenase [Chlamydiales bacterium]|nr:acyl-CoA/acyl-ACP dehydrogenase [Chlamydiales bacterium]